MKTWSNQTKNSCKRGGVPLSWNVAPRRYAGWNSTSIGSFHSGWPHRPQKGISGLGPNPSISLSNSLQKWPDLKLQAPGSDLKDLGRFTLERKTKNKMKMHDPVRIYHQVREQAQEQAHEQARKEAQAFALDFGPDQDQVQEQAQAGAEQGAEKAQGKCRTTKSGSSVERIRREQARIRRSRRTIKHKESSMKAQKQAQQAQEHAQNRDIRCNIKCRTT